MEHLSKYTQPRLAGAEITLRSDAVALVDAELDASYVPYVQSVPSVPYGSSEVAAGVGGASKPFSPGHVRVDAEGLTVEREDGTIERFERERLSVAWFVPQFVEKALGLALGGASAERPIVVTADFVGWLVFVVDGSRWLCVATNDRDAAIAAMDAVGLGALSGAHSWALFEQGDRRTTGARWLRSQARVRRAMGATVVSSVAIDAAFGYIGSLAGISIVTAAGALAVLTVTVARRAVTQRLSRWSVDPAAKSALIERPDAKTQRFDLRKIEGARLTRTGFVLEYEDAPRPIAIDVLEPAEGARATENSRVELARLRVAHTFVDHAIAARDALIRRA